jgi:hypothetical protein
MIRRLARVARTVDLYANAACAFLVLVAALTLITALTVAVFGFYLIAANLIPLALTFGVPPALVLLGRHINPEGHK